MQHTTVPKIKEALNFMRNHSLEVPFIVNYRREYVEPELNVHDLWKVLHLDEEVGVNMAYGSYATVSHVICGLK